LTGRHRRLGRHVRRRGGVGEGALGVLLVDCGGQPVGQDLKGITKVLANPVTSSPGSNAAGRLASELRLARKYDSALFQPVANHVSLISKINPRRESATESRLQLVTSANMNKRGAANRFCDGRSVSAKVGREIDK
jgi:hypothetical protein